VFIIAMEITFPFNGTKFNPLAAPDRTAEGRYP
jgi:hypothetical protein